PSKRSLRFGSGSFRVTLSKIKACGLLMRRKLIEAREAMHPRLPGHPRKARLSSRRIGASRAFLPLKRWCARRRKIDFAEIRIDVIDTECVPIIGERCDTRTAT